MKPSEVRQAAADLLGTSVAERLLGRLLDEAAEAFEAEGFVRGTVCKYPLGDAEQWRLLHRGVTFTDPLSGHAVLVHADLTVGYGPGVMGQSGLRLTVLGPPSEPLPPGERPWDRAEKVLSVTLVEPEPMPSGFTLSQLCQARLGGWAALLEGPTAFDFDVAVKRALVDYCSKVCP